MYTDSLGDPVSIFRSEYGVNVDADPSLAEILLGDHQISETLGRCTPGSGTDSLFRSDIDIVCRQAGSSPRWTGPHMLILLTID